MLDSLLFILAISPQGDRIPQKDTAIVRDTRGVSFHSDELTIPKGSSHCVKYSNIFTQIDHIFSNCCSMILVYATIVGMGV